jgi:hypothetical protein
MKNDMSYVYVLEIDFEDKEIIYTKSDKIMWTMIPFDLERLQALADEYPNYDFVLLDESILRFNDDRRSIMFPN